MGGIVTAFRPPSRLSNWSSSASTIPGRGRRRLRKIAESSGVVIKKTWFSGSPSGPTTLQFWRRQSCSSPCKLKVVRTMIRLSALAGEANSSRNIAAGSHVRWFMTLSRRVDLRAAISAQSGPRDRLLKPESHTKIFVTQTLAINHLSLNGRFFLQGCNLR